MILYFTGTGNSRYIAEKLSNILGDSVVSINDYLKHNKNGIFQEEERYIFSLPTYGWRIPRVVEKFIKTATFEKNIDTYFVMNYGADMGNAKKYIEKLCNEKNLNLRDTFGITMPENYIALFNSPTIEEEKEILKAANIVIKEIADSISNEKISIKEKLTLADKIKSGIVNDIFYKIIVKAKPFYAEDTCIACGKCEVNCPLNNISMNHGKPIWSSNCTHCMACISLCPVEAIEYGNKSQGKRRYNKPPYTL